MKNICIKAAIFIFAMIPKILWAGTYVGFAINGNIARPSGEAVNSGVVAFSLKVLDPSNNCLLWSEVQNFNMTNSDGAFSLIFGAGTRTDGGSHTLKQVFTNAGTLGSLSCTSGSTYSPTANEDRNLSIIFNDGGTVVSLSPMSIKSAPFAMQADQVSGYGILNLAKISGAGSVTTLTPYQFDFLAALAAPAIASSTPCVSNDILKFVGGVWSCAADATGGSPGDVSYAAKGIVQFNTDAATSGVTVAAGVATLNTGIGANQIPKLDASANFGVGIAPTTRLDVNGAITQRGMAAPAVSSASTGRIYYDSTTNHFYYSENGGAYTQLSSATGALSSVSSIANSGGNITLAPVTTTGAVLINSGTPSVGAASGALVITGGIGTSGDIYSSATINAATTMTAGTSIYSPQLYGSASASGNIKIDGTSNAAKGNVLLAIAGGNVGVGTTAPAVSMDMSGKTDSIRVPAGTTAQRPAAPANGDIRVNSTNGTLETYLSSAWMDLTNAIMKRANITGTPFTVTSTQGGYYLSYNNAASGTVNLPALSGLADGWSVTIVRKVAQSVTLTPNGADAFDNGVTSLEMRGQNIKSITLMNNGGVWSVINKTDDCIVGKSCWGTGNIYIGTYNGSQYFTTPGNCVAGSPYTCNGATDTVTRAWATGAPESSTIIGMSNYTDGRAQTATLAGYASAQAAQFCNNINSTGGYGGYTDWYLPAQNELSFLYQQSQNVSGFVYSNTYNSSTESSSAFSWAYNFQPGIGGTASKTSANYVRCVRRF